MGFPLDESSQTDWVSCETHHEDGFAIGLPGVSCTKVHVCTVSPVFPGHGKPCCLCAGWAVSPRTERMGFSFLSNACMIKP